MNANLSPMRRRNGLGRPSMVLAALAMAAAGAAPPADRPQPDPAARMTVTGRVLDPQGKPVAGASVMVYARSRATRIVLAFERAYPTEIGRATSDGSGRFRLDAPRTISSRHDEFGAVALAPGYGVGWADLAPDADQPAAEIALRPERVIQGRLFDLQGQPARDVKLSVSAIRRVLNKGPNVAFRENFEGPAFWWAHPDDLPGWPGPVTTGADGRFTLHGVGPGLRVFLSVHDPRFFNQGLEVDTGADLSAKPLSVALQPARTITGRVTYADTGKPAPHARVVVTGFDQLQLGVGARPFLAEADAEGRFRTNAGPGVRGAVSSYPPDGQPYLEAFQSIDWPKGAIAQAVDLALPRGAMIRGTVNEPGPGRPVAGAMVMYLAPRAPNDDRFARAGPVETAADGSFALAVPRRPGHLVVRGPDDDYVDQEIGYEQLFEGQKGGERTYAHAFLALDPKPGLEGPDVRVVLHRGVPVKGRVVGPDGKPVPDAWMIGRMTAGTPLGPMRLWTGNQHGIARNGRFQLHGLAPDSEVPVHFLDPKRKLGATAHASGKSASDEPIAVRLESCGTATARLVRPDGRPFASSGGPTRTAIIAMVVTPGPMSSPKTRQEGALLADIGFLTGVDPINYEKFPTSDSQGRIVFPALIPARTTGSSTTRPSAMRPAPRSARSSPSSPARRSTWATSASRSRRLRSDRSTFDGSVGVPPSGGRPIAPGPPEGGTPTRTGEITVGVPPSGGPTLRKKMFTITWDQRTMFVNTPRLIATALLPLVAIATVAASPDDADPKPAPGRMFVVGRVLDPGGKPVPGASVMVYARSLMIGSASSPERIYPGEIGRATSDGSGRFRLDAPRTSSSRQADVGAVALAPGYGAGWVELDPDADEPTADISLRPERVIQGRLFDLQGQPARDVKLSVTAIRRVLSKGPNVGLRASRENFEGPAFWWAHPDDLPGWPRPAISGADGRFTLHGVGPGLTAYLSVHDPRFFNQGIEVDTGADSIAKPMSVALQPARTITGRVTYADTGKPVPLARVVVTGFDQVQIGVGARPFVSETDAEGRFRTNAGPGVRGNVSAVPPDGQPYLIAANRLNWPKGAVAQAVRPALPRGVMIRGTVIEQGSGRPVSGAAVQYVARMLPDDGPGTLRTAPKETAADGSFEIAVPPRPGHLVVRGPDDDYVDQEIGYEQLFEGQKGGERTYAHAFLALDPKPGVESPHARVAIRRGVTVKGRVLGPDAQPIPDARLISRITKEAPLGLLWFWNGADHVIARNGRFELHGLAPDAEVPVHFLDPKRKLARRPASRANPRPPSRSPSGSSPAARPRRGWSGPTASRSLDSADVPDW